MKKFVVGTLVHSPTTADPRDWPAETVLPTPTDLELKNLPESFDHGMYIGATYYQNGWGSCTAMGTTHSMLIQNMKEAQVDNPTLLSKIVADLKAGVNSIFLDRKDLRTKMGHDLNNKNDSGDFAEKAMNTAIKSGIAGKDINGKDFVFYGKNYSYKTAGVTDKDIQLVKYYITKYPIIDVFLGNDNTWAEMTKGEVKTVISVGDSTGGHCISRTGYNAYGLIYTNSRTPNDKTKKKCTFVISWYNYKKAVQSGMINRRYWQLFDKDDAIVDLGKLKEDNNMTILLQTLHDKYKTTSKQNVKDKISDLGKTIRAEYPVADKNVPKAGSI